MISLPLILISLILIVVIGLAISQYFEESETLKTKDEGDEPNNLQSDEKTPLSSNILKEKLKNLKNSSQNIRKFSRLFIIDLELGIKHTELTEVAVVELLKDIVKGANNDDLVVLKAEK